MVEYWERSADPYHPEALKGIWPGIKGKQPRREGWMGIDWAENAIGFVPDGTVYDYVPPFEIIAEPKEALPSGNVFAVRIPETWVYAARGIAHEGEYVELDASFHAILDESERGDVKYLILSVGCWNALGAHIVAYAAETASNLGEAPRQTPKGCVAILNGVPVYSDTIRTDVTWQVLKGRAFSVRKRTTPLIRDTKQYEFLFGVTECRR